MKEDRKKLVVTPIIKDENGKVMELTEYVVKEVPVGDGKVIRGGIDWEKTKELAREADEETIKAIEYIEKQGEVEIDKNVDSEFFVAGAMREKKEDD